MILLGAPGVGKGTQAEKIANQYQIPHISTGDIFRSNMKAHTKLGEQAKAYMDAGTLVPDDLVVALVADRIAQEDCQTGYILDGFPRTIPQAEALEETLHKRGLALDYVFHIVVPDEEIIARMSGRRACENCGGTYHIKYRKSKQEGICDICAGKLITRQDDTEETVRKRLSVYHTQTQPLIQFYEEKGLLVSIDGVAEMDDVFKQIREQIEKD